MFVENNPFTPSFGRIPPFMAGRKMLINDLSKAFAGNGNDPYLQTIFVGARGTGKTAILAYAARIALSKGWVCANTSCAPGMLDDILERAREASSEIIEQPQGAKLKGVQIGQVLGVEWEPAKESPANWRTHMTRLLEDLDRYDTGLLITIDEIQGDLGELEQFAAIYQHFIRENRRVALLMAGLPHHVSRLLNSKSVSFLRRANRVTLGRVEDMEVEDALLQTVESGGKAIDRPALECCTKVIAGFPYMMQLVGFRTWDVSGESPVITKDDANRGSAEAQHDLERQILLPTWASLSDGDRRFCQALAHGSKTSKEIAATLDKKPNYVSKYKQRLLEQGVIEEDIDSALNFAIPGFGDFVLRRG